MTEDQMMIAHSFSCVETTKLQEVISGCYQPQNEWHGLLNFGDSFNALFDVANWWTVLLLASNVYYTLLFNVFSWKWTLSRVLVVNSASLGIILTTRVGPPSFRPLKSQANPSL